MSRSGYWDEELRARSQADRLRRAQALPPRADGRTWVDFSSNDYLGLSRHPEVVGAARQALEAFGAGSGASRLVTGTLPIHTAFEREFAAWAGREAALLFATGYQLNLSVMEALADRNSTVYMDRLNHHSLYAGVVASRARMVRYHHADAADLRRRLEADRNRPGRKLLVTESVFSMDGDRAPLAELTALANEFDLLFVVDEAHAVGLMGRGGRGLAADNPRVDAWIATFGKAFGGAGGAVAGSHRLIDYLQNTAGGFIYTTAPPPAQVGALAGALALIPGLDAQRAELAARADRLRAAVRGAGFDTRGSASPIVPAVTGSDASALALARRLADAGVWAQPIRPPTVEPGTARLRLTATVRHTDADLALLEAALRA